jgi:hypothetical protein
MFELLGRKTPSIYLGAPEAEADATHRSRMPLPEVYEDYHGLLQALGSEKFIVIGRKGAGKSACAEYVYANAIRSPNLFCEFVRATDFKLESAIQVGEKTDSAINTETFFLWLIYTNILKLFVNSQAVQEDKEFETLRQFLSRNSGYINIKEYEIKSLIQKQGFEVSIEYFRRFFRSRMNRDVEIKSERAPYYKLLPHLEEVIQRVLTSPFERTNSNGYFVFFDDLDIWFSAAETRSSDALISLLRASKRVNNEVFGKHGILAKAVILMRDDIASYLASRYADSAKIFSSYSCHIDWYQEQYAGKPDFEDQLNLKRFINRRIKYAFAAAQRAIDETDPWSALVSPAISDRSSFKYVVNQTLFRPRDLLLFFKPLESGSYAYPLKKSEINTLIGAYSSELAKEIKSELSSFYSSEQVETIFSALSEINREHVTYREAMQVVQEHCKDVNAEELLDYLFDRSIIGNVGANNWFYFACRHPVQASAPLLLSRNQQVVVQYGISAYLHQRYR